MQFNRVDTTMANTGTKQARGKTTTSRSKTTAKASKAPRKSATSRKRKETRITPEIRTRMIAEAAYLEAEQQGFHGDPVEHWLNAERRIDAMLAERATGTAQ